VSGSRERILAAVRAGLGRTGELAGTQADAMQTYLASHPQGPRPRSDWRPAARFRERALQLSSTLDTVPTMAAVPAAIARYFGERSLPARAVVWPQLAALDWSGAGIAAEARPAEERDLIGVTGCFCAIAETGTLLLASGAATPGSVSLLPETHIAVVPCERIVLGMEEAWALLRAELGALPRAVNFVSGPSRTADIEQTLVLGAHGPYRVHIVLVGEAVSA
jgi:L-lactate dehydrogenase complex protein LldG